MYEPLNLTPLLKDGVPAVRVRTQEQSDHFLYELKRQYNQRFMKQSGYFYKSKDQTVYVPRINESSVGSMTYTDVKGALSCGYEVIEFDSLLRPQDLPEFEAPDMQLFTLLGL